MLLHCVSTLMEQLTSKALVALLNPHAMVVSNPALMPTLTHLRDRYLRLRQYNVSLLLDVRARDFFAMHRQWELEAQRMCVLNQTSVSLSVHWSADRIVPGHSIVQACVDMASVSVPLRITNHSYHVSRALLLVGVIGGEAISRSLCVCSHAGESTVGPSKFDVACKSNIVFAVYVSSHRWLGCLSDAHASCSSTDTTECSRVACTVIHHHRARVSPAE
jgi:hypothetical protein